MKTIPVEKRCTKCDRTESECGATPKEKKLSWGCFHELKDPDDRLRPDVKLTPEVRKRVLDLLRAGNFREVAAVSAGIKRTTFSGWISKGARGEKFYSEFLEQVEQAEAEAEARGITQMAILGKKDPKALQWLMSRRFRSRWGDKSEMELSGKGGGPVEVTLSAIDAAMKACEENEKDD